MLNLFRIMMQSYVKKKWLPKKSKKKWNPCTFANIVPKPCTIPKDATRLWGTLARGCEEDVCVWIRNNSQHYTFSSNFVSYYSWCSIRVSTKPILPLPICSPTAIEVSHPYRCRCLTHTCVSVSPIHVLVSHPYTQRGLTHRCSFSPPLVLLGFVVVRS